MTGEVTFVRRRNGSGGVALGTVATARNGYQRQGFIVLRRPIYLLPK